MKYRHPTTIRSYSNRLHGLRPTMRTNVFLRGHCNYQPPICHPLHWHRPCPMNLRWILSRQSHPYPILRLPLYSPLRHRCPGNSPPPIPPRNRLKQPHRHYLRCRQNPLPPLLHHQRRSWLPTPNHPSPHSSLILPRPPRRPRQLYPRQPTQHPTTYQTRMILPIRIRHSPLHP